MNTEDVSHVTQEDNLHNNDSLLLATNSDGYMNPESFKRMST